MQQTLVQFLHHFFSSPLTILSTSQTNGQKYTHRHTQTQGSTELQLCSPVTSSPFSPPQGQWGCGIRQPFIKGSDWQLPHKAELPALELHKGQALRNSEGFYEPAYPPGANVTIFLGAPWSSHSHPVPMKGERGGMLNSASTSYWEQVVTERGRAWGRLVKSRSLAPPWSPLCDLTSCCTPFSFPKSSCKGQGSQNMRKREENYNMEDPFSLFCHFSAVPKISFVQKQKKKSSVCQDFYLSHMKGYRLLHILKCLKNGYQRVRGPLI